MHWFRFFLALALATTASAETNADDTLITTKDCAQISTSSEGDEYETVCGFSSVEMNAEGDRLVTVSVANNLQLWDRDGHELLKTPVLGQFGAVGSSIIQGGKLLLIPEKGMLVGYDLQIGKETSR